MPAMRCSTRTTWYVSESSHTRPLTTTGSDHVKQSWCPRGSSASSPLPSGLVDVNSMITVFRSLPLPNPPETNVYSARCDGSRNASGSFESGFESVQPARSFLSLSRGGLPLTRSSSRTTLASAPSPFSLSASTRSSYSVTRAKPSGA